jgi:hypothetical protein
LIAIVGAWDLYEDQYDQQVKINWYQFLKSRAATEKSEAQDASGEQGD